MIATKIHIERERIQCVFGLGGGLDTRSLIMLERGSRYSSTGRAS
jgi:hypothetical protein